MPSRFSWRIMMFCALLLLALVVLQTTLGRAAPARNDGFLYGRVTTETGKVYTGVLRWGGEEAFWDDLFDSAKRDLPYFDEADKAQQLDAKGGAGGKDRGDAGARARDRERQRESRRSFDVFGRHIIIEGLEGGGKSSRIFRARFGDIARIRVQSGDRAELLMKSGTTLRVEGYANDVGGIVTVHDEKLGEKNLSWERIDQIEFLPAPAGCDPGATRLRGVVETSAGTFTGFIQWDKEECLSTDRLDAEDDEGDVQLPMGRIRAIERRGASGCLVTLRDGQSLRLRGTNDVNEDNRGIMVEDPRFGRVTIPWEQFDKATFSDPAGSGPGYGDYPPGKPLAGVVRDARGRQLRGRLVFDLDEAESWEMLNGRLDEIEYDIPFALVGRMRPQEGDGALVTLRDGLELRLEESQDVTESNAGLLIYERADRLTFVPWKDAVEIRFEP